MAGKENEMSNKEFKKSMEELGEELDEFQKKIDLQTLKINENGSGVIAWINQHRLLSSALEINEKRMNITNEQLKKLKASFGENSSKANKLEKDFASLETVQEKLKSSYKGHYSILAGLKNVISGVGSVIETAIGTATAGFVSLSSVLAKEIGVQGLLAGTKLVGSAMIEAGKQVGQMAIHASQTANDLVTMSSKRDVYRTTSENEACVICTWSRSWNNDRKHG